MTKTLGAVFRDLSFGPLSNLSIGSEGIGTIAGVQQDRVVSLVNQGTRWLYARFIIYRKELFIETIEGRKKYPLKVEHADSVAGGGEKYIKDSSANPFTGDLLRILAVWDPEGHETPLNMLGEETSLRTPNPYTLLIPEFEPGTLYRVAYQAAPEPLLTTDEEQELYLPEPLYEALEAFVAHKVFRSMNGEEHRRQAIDQFNTFEGICNELINNDLAKESHNSGYTKLEDRGFV